MKNIAGRAYAFRWLLAVLVLGVLFATPALASVIKTTHLSSDAAMSKIIQNKYYYCEGRIGGLLYHEIALKAGNGNNLSSRNFDWGNNRDHWFEMESTASAITYKVDGALVGVASGPCPATELFVRTYAANKKCGVIVYDMFLNGKPVPGYCLANGDEKGLDILRITDSVIADGFKLVGKVRMGWDPWWKPTGDKLCFQVYVTDTVGDQRQCFIPVTFTQAGWRFFCNPGQTLIPGGIVYNRFPKVFACYTWFGTTFKNRVIIGAPRAVLAPGTHSLTFEGTTFGLSQLCRFLPQYGPCDQLYLDYLNPPYYLLDKNGNPAQNVLAGETLALLLNIAYNKMRMMPRTLGYDLEKFVLLGSVYRGKTVGEVFNIANAVLSGVPPCNFGLPPMGMPQNPAAQCATLVEILKKINANYEFLSYNTFIDRGFLKPNRPFGPPDPPCPVVVPFPC